MCKNVNKKTIKMEFTHQVSSKSRFYYKNRQYLTDKDPGESEVSFLHKVE